MANMHNIGELLAELTTITRECKEALIRNTVQAELAAASIRDDAVVRIKLVDMIREHDPTFASDPIVHKQPKWRVHRERWTETDDTELMRLFGDDIESSRIAHLMGRTIQAIHSRHKRLRHKAAELEQELSDG